MMGQCYNKLFFFNDLEAALPGVATTKQSLRNHRT